MLRRFLVPLVLACAAPQGALGEDGLASDPTWLRLGQWDGGGPSAIVSEDFFLARDGRADPQAELEATLEALQEPLTGDLDQHALCRYPARALFLAEREAVPLPDPFETCPAFAVWSSEGDIGGVSLLFVAGYFSNPGSAFGHILLRLHKGDDDLGVEDVLDRAINYGAAASEEDPLVPYILKGLTGQYRSTYSGLDFYHHSERFREEQLRDVWQYRLALDDSEVRLLTAHIWELLRAENRYYFLRQNCAYRIARLLELVAGRRLVPATKVWMAPSDAFFMLTRKIEGESVPLAGVKRLASRETVFAEGYERLGAHERSFVDAVIAEPGMSLDVLADSHPAAARPAGYDVLLDYYAFAAAENTALEPRQRDVLAARYALPASSPPVVEPPVPPHEGQPSSLLQVSALSNDVLGAGAEFRIRPAYFDFLSATEGTAPYAELSMADLRIVARDDGVHLRSLEAVRVTSLGLATSGVPGRQEAAWRFRAGAETRDLSCDDCLLAYAEGSFGKAAELMGGVAVYGLLGGRLEAGAATNSTLNGLATAGIILRGALFLEGGVQQGLDEAERTLPFARGEILLGSGRRWDLRITGQHREASEFGLALSGYW